MPEVATRARSGFLYTEREGDGFHLALENEVLVLFVEPRTGRGAAVSLALGSGLVARTLGALNEASAYFGRQNSLCAKLLGPHSAFAAVHDVLRAEAVTVLSETPCQAAYEVLFFPKEARLRLARGARATEHGKEAAGSGKIRVLIVDDSPTIQKLLSRILSEDPRIEVVDACGDPLQVEERVEKLKPDVVTLDIHMPGMNGVELLKKLLARRSLPAVMISSLGMEEGSLVLDALEAGAVDYVQKPSFENLAQVAETIREKVKGAAASRVRSAVRSPARLPTPVRAMDEDALLLIGASTGGTEAIRAVLTSLPEQVPPILIVQHIPPVFSKAFAERMNELCRFEVREAQDGEVLEPGIAWIAPGGTQMTVESHGGQLRLKVDPNAGPMNRHKPSVDALFLSAARLKRKRMAAMILTGMGADGAKGLLELRKAGVRTAAQDEASCVVYGMPREAALIGAAEKVVPLGEMAETVGGWLAPKPSAQSA